MRRTRSVAAIELRQMSTKVGEVLAGEPAHSVANPRPLPRPLRRGPSQPARRASSESGVGLQEARRRGCSAEVRRLPSPDSQGRGAGGHLLENLETMTPMSPELVAAAGGLKVESVILGGEAIAYSPVSEEYVPFSGDNRATPQGGVDEFARRVPLRAFVFDDLSRRVGPDAPAVREAAGGRQRGAWWSGHPAAGAAHQDRLDRGADP